MISLIAIEPAWIAAIATAGGAIAIKVAEKIMNRTKETTDDARLMRNELREQIVSQKEDIIRLESELEEWRDKYYDLRDSYMEQYTKLTLALEKIKSISIPAIEATVVNNNHDIDADNGT